MTTTKLQTELQDPNWSAFESREGHDSLATELEVMRPLEAMARAVAEVNFDNKWFEDDRRFGEDMALLASEVSEALEAWRDGDHVTVVNEKGKPEGMPSELADVLIRLLDTVYRYNVDLDKEFWLKLKFNRTRGPKHGGKLL